MKAGRRRDAWPTCTELDKLEAAIAAGDKSPALLYAIIYGVWATTSGRTISATRGEKILVELLTEPALNGEHLAAMAPRDLGRVLHGPTLLLAICAHPQVRDRTVIDALWGAPQATAVAAGAVLPAAINWVRRELDRKELPGPRMWYVDDALEAQILTTAARWAAWAGTDPARTAFLAHGSFAFTCEDELLHAGGALTASAGRTP